MSSEPSRPVSNVPPASSSYLDDLFKPFPVLSNPKEALAKEKPNASFMAGLKNFVLGAVVAAVLNLLLFFILSLNVADERESVAWVGGFFSFMLLVGIPVGSVLLSAGFFAMAKLLGGKGEFATQYYLASLFAVPVSALIVIASLILSPLLALFVAFLYGLYYMTLVLMEAHEFGMVKAVVSWLVPGIVLFVLFLIVTFFFAALLYAAAKGMPANSTA